MSTHEQRRHRAYWLYGITLAVVLLEEAIGFAGGPWQTISETVWDLGDYWAGSIVVIIASLAVLLFHFAIPGWPGSQFRKK